MLLPSIDIYGIESCEDCDESIRLCEIYELKYRTFNLRNEDILRRLQERMGQVITTVPLIFANGQYLSGGLRDLRHILLNHD
jgi:glutaredoxin